MQQLFLAHWWGNTTELLGFNFQKYQRPAFLILYEIRYKEIDKQNLSQIWYIRPSSPFRSTKLEWVICYQFLQRNLKHVFLSEKAIYILGNHALINHRREKIPINISDVCWYSRVTLTKSVNIVRKQLG